MVFRARLASMSRWKNSEANGRSKSRASRSKKRKQTRLSQAAGCCGLGVELLEERVMLSATAAYQPAYAIAGHVTPLGAKPADTLATAPYTPAQMTTAYGVNQISFGGTPGTGAGQTIAIVDAYDDPDIINDTATFNTTYNLPQFNAAGGPTLTILNQNGGTSLPVTTSPTGWDLEESLDVQWAHSIAPQANIIVFESNTNNDSDMDTAVATAAAYPGVSAVSMSWGEGEWDGEQSEDSYFLTPTGHQGVTFLASSGDWGSPPIYPSVSPNIVSIGGTSLYIDQDGTYDYETPWNNSIGATGGGPSAYEAQPSYQVGNVNGTSTTNRTSPDISMDADPYTGVPVLDTFESGWYQVGGTSLSCPMTAGLIAIANQGRALQGEGTLNGLTQTLPTLYNLPASDFNDITTGSNGTYPATAGYDLASGIGTPIANLLVPALADSTIDWAPTVSGPSTATTNENSTLSFANSNAITVTDLTAGSSLTDSLTLSVGDGTLTLGSTSGLTFGSGANGSASMTVSGLPSDLDAALATLTYTPNSGYSGTDSLAISLSDPAANQTASTSVALTINPPPTVAAPASLSTPENAPISFTGASAITIGDLAAGNGADSLTLSVGDGKLTLGTTSGLSFGATANGSPSLTVTGTLGNLEAALASLTYTPTTGYMGPDSLTVSILDAGDGLSASTSVRLTVNGPSTPTISAPTSASTYKNLAFTFSGVNAITVSDASTAGLPDSLKISVSHGALTLGSTSGLTFTAGSNATSTMTVTGTLSNLDAALTGLTYTPNTGFTGSDSLKLAFTDTATKLAASSTVSLSVTMPNPPSVTAPATAALYEDSSLTFSGPTAITVADAAAGSNADSLKLTVSHGTLALASTSGLTFTAGSSGTATMTVTGTISNLEAALTGLVYTPKQGYSGSDSLKLALTDPLYKLNGSAAVAITVSVPASTPTATVGTPVTTSVPGEPVPLVFQVSDTNATAQSASFSFAISFGDGTSTTVSSAAPILDNHVYKTTGKYTVTVTATDEFGHQSAAGTVVINVVPAAVETNPFNTSQTALFVGGTSAKDTIKFTESGSNIAVTLDGVSEGTFNTSGPFIIFGQGGKDTVTEGAGVTNTVDLLETPSADNFETDVDNEALQWAGLTAAVEILNR